MGHTTLRTLAAVALSIGTCIVLLSTPSAPLAAQSSYPQFATVAGTGVSATDPKAIAVAAPLEVPSYDVPETAAQPEAEPSSSSGNSTLMWGYEAAATGARLLSYNTAPFTAGSQCVPITSTGETSQNGRGVAFDPLDGNLWYSFVAFPGFNGDGFIHKNTPPQTGCAPITSIPFADGPGGAVQDDIGAIDVDEATKHLWVAGYKPVSVQGVLLSFIYKVNRNTGQVINYCAIPFRGGGVGNDTLTVFRSTTLPGSSKYLLTDAGETTTVPNTLAVIDQADCHSGRIVVPVTEVPKTTPGGMAGIDFEWLGLLNTNNLLIFNNANFPFTAPQPLGPANAQLEDISMCGFRAKFGGDGNDFCPYTVP